MMNEHGDADSVRPFTSKIKHDADISPSSANIISDKFYQEGRINKCAGTRKAVWLVSYNVIVFCRVSYSVTFKSVP